MITVNGIENGDLSGMKLADFLEFHGYHPERVVVELNRDIVPKKDYADTILRDGDVMEILNFVGGG